MKDSFHQQYNPTYNWFLGRQHDLLACEGGFRSLADGEDVEFDVEEDVKSGDPGETFPATNGGFVFGGKSFGRPKGDYSDLTRPIFPLKWWRFGFGKWDPVNFEI